MMQESLINSPLLAGLAITLIHFLWQGALVALVLKTLLSLISYQKSQLRYALSAVAMLANLVLPIITFVIVYDIEFRQATNFVQTLPLLHQSFYFEQVTVNAWYMEWLEYLPAISIVWLAVVTILALKLIIELYNVNQLPRQGCTAVDAALQRRFDALRNKVGLSRKVVLLLSSKTNVPMAIGWLKPVVLLPLSMLSGLSPQQLDMLLLHELAHIRRHDYLVNFFQTLVEILLFFHPAVRWVSKQMRNEREYCSDDIAVQHSGSSIAYAHTLADTASICHKHRHKSIPNMAMAASGGDLKQRVVRLLEQQHHCTKATDSGKWFASFMILLAITLVFSQQSLTLPIIDLQSGSISIQHSARQLNESAITYTPLAFERVKTKNSLASQLLAIDSSNANEQPVPVATVMLPQDTIKQAITVSPKAQLNQRNTVNENLSKAFYNELPIVHTDAKVVKNAAQHHAELKTQTQVNQNLNTVLNKSISDFAFERTDSTNATVAAKANPYSQQLASLLIEPEFSSDDNIAALSKTHYGLSNRLNTPSNSALPIATLSQSKATITVGKPPKVQTKSMAAKLIDSVEPKYPSSAKRKGIELEIMVEFNIDKNGLVKNIQFESKSKVSYFRNSIRNAMKDWRFLPAKKNGRAIESKMSKIFSFSLLT